MAVGVPTIEAARVRQNYLAIVVAAVACFLLEAGWYSYFMQTWLTGIGRTRDWLMAAGVEPGIAVWHGTGFGGGDRHCDLLRDATYRGADDAARGAGCVAVVVRICAAYVGNRIRV